MPDVPGMHHDELLVQADVARPFVRPVLGPQPRRVDPVRDHAHPLRRRTFFLEAPPHRVADGDDPVGPAEIERDERAEDPHHHGVLQTLQLHRDLRENVLADDDERHPEPAGDEQRDVCHDRRVGHAEHDVGPRPAEPVMQCIPQIGDVVGGARQQPAPLERGGRDAHDLDRVVHGATRLALVAVQYSGHDLHLDLIRERLAEIGEQLGRRLDSGPVVLIQDEEARLAGRRHGEQG